MRLLSARLIIALIVGVTLVSLCSSYYDVVVEKRSLRRDLVRRAEVLGESLAGNVERDVQKDSMRDLQRLVERFSNREHLLGLAVYDEQGKEIAITKAMAPVLSTTPPILWQTLKNNQGVGTFDRKSPAYLLLYALPLHG